MGKSTLAVNLACALVSRRDRVVLVDADDQATASLWAQEGRLPLPVVAHPVESEEAAEELIHRLARLREEVPLVVVDLPPHLGFATAAALAVADLLVTPVTPSGADLQATGRALALLEEARQARQDGRPACLLVPSRVDRRTGPGREIVAVLQEFGLPVAPAVGQRTAQVDAYTTGQWIGDYAPGSAAHREIKALAAAVRRALA
ncbi:MAG: ParA family protein [Deltaproteobacteria bacterium]|nr:ParA family protein [Deltaproteobacteria bacterium]